MIIFKILVLIASIFACILVIKYRLQMVNTFGKAYWAEKYLGSGGSYTMWIIIGILMVFLAAAWLVGTPLDHSATPSQSTANTSQSF
jgi:hypothetical protein